MAAAPYRRGYVPGTDVTDRLIGGGKPVLMSVVKLSQYLN